MTQKEEYPQIDTVISQARPLIFDFNYPIWDVAYKPVLETKIIENFYFREICDVPVARWKMMLRQKLNKIMPYYNQLYFSTTLEYNPLYTVDYQHDSKRDTDTNAAASTDSTIDTTSNGTSNSNGTSSSSGTSDSNSSSTTSTNGTTTGNTTDDTTTDATAANSVTGKTTTRNSDTPQGTLVNLENNTYMTSAQIADTTQDTDSSSNSTVASKGTSSTEQNSSTVGDVVEKGQTTANGTTEDTTTTTNKGNETGKQSSNSNSSVDDTFSEHIFGKNNSQSYPSLIMEYRDTIVNIDAMILDELEELFFLLY